MTLRPPHRGQENLGTSAATPLGPPAREPDPGKSRTALTVSLLGFFVITLDALIVNVALAAIGRQLGGGTVGQQW